jgi:hypothetical protein
VFTINPETMVAKYLGDIKGLPEKFTTNGMVVNDEGALLVSSAVDASGWFVVDPVSLKATPYSAAASVFRSSDLANSNILSLKKKLMSIPVILQPQVKNAGLVQIYPNPVTTDALTLRFSDFNSGAYTVQIVDLTGRQVIKQRINLGYKNQLQGISLPPVRAKGVYMVKVLDLNKKTVFEQKIMVQ